MDAIVAEPARGRYGCNRSFRALRRGPAPRRVAASMPARVTRTT
jgi:hypothetical protein